MKGSSSSASDIRDSGLPGAERWLRIGLKPFSLLIVSHRAPSKDFVYVGSEADIAALDSKTLRALMTGLVGAEQKFANREAAVSEAWRIITDGLEKARNVPGASPKADSANDRRAVLQQEVETLRATLAIKSSELRALGGGKHAEGSTTVTRIVELLVAGATKTELVAASGAKRGYVDALLSRILPERGYTISSTRAEGAKEKTYRAMKTQANDNASLPSSDEAQTSNKKAEAGERTD